MFRVGEKRLKYDGGRKPAVRRRLRQYLSNQNCWMMMMIAFITSNSGLVPLSEGLMMMIAFITIKSTLD